MKAIELCAGAGLASRGFQLAGWDVHGIEFDADAVDTHRRHVGPCDHADVRSWNPVFSADLVGGGVPCTTFSPAGKRGGLNDPRGELYLDVLRVADEANARAVWLENSAGITTWRDHRGTAGSFIEAEFQARGWHTTSAILCAADFGVPQERYRWILVGFRDAETLRAFRWPEPTHCEHNNLFGLPRWATVRQALGLGDGDYSHGREPGATGWNGQRYVDVDVDVAAPTVTGRTNPEMLSRLDRPAPTVTTSTEAFAKGSPSAFRKGKGQCRQIREQVAAAGSRLDRSAPTISAGGTGSGGGAESIANKDIRADLLGALAHAGVLDRPGTTITCDPRLPPAGHHERQQKGAVRLTTEQCAILQDVEPGWTFTGNKSSQHRQIGNGFPRRFAQAIATSILAALRSAKTRAA